MAAGQSAINFYKNNFMVSTTTLDGTRFVTMIKDWDAVLAIKNTWANDLNGLNELYEDYGAEWLIANNGMTNADLADATAYALVKIFGSAITIAKAAPNSNSFRVIEELPATHLPPPAYLVLRNCGEPIERKTIGAGKLTYNN